MARALNVTEERRERRPLLTLNAPIASSLLNIFILAQITIKENAAGKAETTQTMHSGQKPDDGIQQRFQINSS